jgi:hypothetical protein
MSFLSNAWVVHYDEASKSLLISHPDTATFADPLVNIRAETYSAMSLEELSEFLGSRLLLLMPAMRARFEPEIEKLSNSEHGKRSRGSKTGTDHD